MDSGATRRVGIARRHAVLGLLVAVSLLYWLGAVAAITAASEEALAHGAAEEVVALEAFAWSMDATWLWVMGAVVVHAAAGLVAWWRGDSEALRGVGASALFHALFAWTWGVVRP